METIKKLLNFSKKMVRTELKNLNYELLNEHDFLGMAYEVGFETEAEAKKIIVRSVFKEKYRILGMKQSHILNLSCGEKHCKYCNKYKSYSEFGTIYDVRYDFYYYRNRCTDCMSDLAKSEAFKEKRRKNYSLNPVEKEKASKRATEWNKANREKFNERRRMKRRAS